MSRPRLHSTSTSTHLNIVTPHDFWATLHSFQTASSNISPINLESTSPVVNLAAQALIDQLLRRAGGIPHQATFPDSNIIQVSLPDADSGFLHPIVVDGM